MIDIRWYGRGGQGAFTAARLLGRVMSVYKNSYALAYPSFGPERRGAPVWSFTTIDESKILDRSQPEKCNYLIALDETLITEEICKVLEKDSIVIMNTANPGNYPFIKQKIINLDATQMAIDILGRPITNMAMLGAFIGVSELAGIEDVAKTMKAHFNPKLYEKNKILMEQAYATVKGDDGVE